LLGFTFLRLLVNLVWFTPTCLTSNWLVTYTEVKVSDIFICFTFMLYIVLLFVLIVSL
jgi:hypothetical protein